ncbi:hypothetical protein [Mycolicibacterium brumae]|uniref:Uncharacterized protein n=1 Tax=Mycolicibacterium brumae TaxID=85968 RepID=A0A2G5PBK1_9MYCO|nr:hypothetical protein [Mycolicibacterium brumae]MCV7191462.1 hypothetical protein [Mycolicibacterium brumae]PIB75729.1 hypothetical protein CQY22_008305 [Mycolicibacterium brumae]RWA16174.1 hypothetical protein MBRU_08680 [Mycolicibacterium brumae DSM 44177]UWW09430.1 hypothetical protein L2Z93_002530 [Mycolicibacterium brumae]
MGADIFVLLSITHGELMSSAFQQAFYHAVAAFAGSKDQRAFINTRQTSMSMPLRRAVCASQR